MDNDIFLDKIQLGMAIVDKELKVITQYNFLMRTIREEPDLAKDPTNYDFYYIVWASLSELYDFLEYDYLDKLTKLEQKQISEIMSRYRLNKPLNIYDLYLAYNNIRKIMSLTKFHDIVRKAEEIGLQGLGKLKERYKL